MQKWRQWETASKADWRTALEREAVIRVLAEEHELTGERIREAMQRLNLSRSVIYKLLPRFRQTTSNLIPASLETGTSIMHGPTANETHCAGEWILVCRQSTI